MKRSFRSFAVAAVVLGMFAPAHAAAPAASGSRVIPLTIDEAVAIAVRDNRTVLLQAEDVVKAKARVAESRSFLFPSVVLGANRTMTYNLYPDSLNQTGFQFSVRQYLYRGGRTTSTIEQSRNLHDAELAVLERTKLEIATSVKRTYYTLVYASLYHSLNENIVNNSASHLQLIQRRYDRGQASELEVLKAKESLESVTSAYTVSENQVATAQNLLKSLLYVEDAVVIEPRSNFVYEPREMALDQAYLHALEKRPEIKQYEALRKANQNSVEIAKGDSRPSVYASWDYYNSSHILGNENWNDYGTIGIAVSWPVFDGWAARARVDQALAGVRAVERASEQLRKDIGVELKDAYYALKNAIAGVKAAEAEVETYDQNFRYIDEQYRKGLASELDRADAYLRKDVSLFKKSQSIYEYLIATNDFDKATGGY